MVTYRKLTGSLSKSFVSTDDGLTWGGEVSTGVTGSEPQTIQLFGNNSGNT